MDEHQDESINIDSIPIKWKDLFDQAPCGYLLTHPDGRIFKSNQTLSNLLDYPPAELADGKRRFQDLLSMGGKLFYETRHLMLLKIQDHINEFSYDLLSKNKTRIPVLINTTRVKNDSGQSHYFRFIIFPCSDRNKLEKELIAEKKKAEAATEAKSRFLSTITHEIRTPIHILLAASEFLKDESPRPDQLEMIQTLRTSASNLLNLVNNVLDLNKIEAGKLKLLEEPINLRQLLEDLLQSFRALARSKSLEIRLDLPAQIPTYFLGDRSRITQLITNFIGNSIKFTTEGFVTLELKIREGLLDKHDLHFKIKDSGIGMTREELNHIFKPFEQANDRTHQQFGGTGLGLTISQRILNAYGSKLIVQSEKGAGTEFAFILSLPEAEVQTANDIKDADTYDFEPLEDIRLLMVDDNNSNLIVAERYLKKWGLQYELVLSGPQAIQRLKEKEFDVIMMDLYMPGMDGYETSRQIRQLSVQKKKPTPIVAISAIAYHDHPAGMAETGIVDLITKPYTPEDFHRIIKKYGRQQKSQEESTSKDFTSGAKKSWSHPLPTLDEANKLLDNDPELLKTYLTAVAEEVKEVIGELEMPVLTHTPLSIRLLDHKLQVTFRTLGAEYISTQFKEAISALRKGELEYYQNNLMAITDNLNGFVDWIKKQVEELS